MHHIHRIDQFSVGKIQAVIGTIAGFILGIFMASYAFIANDIIQKSGADSNGFVVGMGIGSVIIFPIVCTIMGFVSGIILAFLYNKIAEKIGGIEIELAEPKEKFE
jgi:hypothetical protein